MNMDNGVKKDYDTIERLVEGLSCDRQGDIEALKESLTEYGIDPDRVLERGLGLFSDFLKKQKLLQARNRLDRMREFIDNTKRDVVQSANEIHKGLAYVMSGELSGAKYQAYYRKLESINPEDFQSLNEDTTLLEFLDKIEELNESDG